MLQYTEIFTTNHKYKIQAETLIKYSGGTNVYLFKISVLFGVRELINGICFIKNNYKTAVLSIKSFIKHLTINSNGKSIKLYIFIFLSVLKKILKGIICCS